MNIRGILLGAFGVLALTAGAATAETLTPLDIGAYDATGFHSPGNTNHIAGVDLSDQYRSFVVFSVPAGTTVTAATLTLDAFDVQNGPNDLALFDVTTGVPQLIAGTGGIAAYADLADGATYGSQAGIVSSQIITISLTPAGVAAINAAQGSTFAIGMVNTTVTGDADWIFGASNTDPDNALILTRAPAPVPTMSELAMILLGLTLASGAAVILSRHRTA